MQVTTSIIYNVHNRTHYVQLTTHITDMQVTTSIMYTHPVQLTTKLHIGQASIGQGRGDSICACLCHVVRATTDSTE